MLWEAMTASPVDARVSPVSIRKVVVLPAPFTPSRPKHCGGEKWGNRKEGGGGREEEMKGEGWREKEEEDDDSLYFPRDSHGGGGHVTTHRLVPFSPLPSAC